MLAIKCASTWKEAINKSKMSQCLSKHCGITAAILNTCCWRSIDPLLMYMRSVSNNHEHWSHTKLDVLCDILMRNWYETWLCWPKVAWRVGACSDEECEVETQRLQIRVDGGRLSHWVQIKFHMTLVLGLEFDSAIGCLALGFFRSRSLRSLNR